MKIVAHEGRDINTKVPCFSEAVLQILLFLDVDALIFWRGPGTKVRMSGVRDESKRLFSPLQEILI